MNQSKTLDGAEFARSQTPTFKINEIKKEVDMWSIGELSDYGNKWRYENKRIVVFVQTPDRPIDNGDVIGDFAWRRNHEAPLPAREVLELVKSYLEANDYIAEGAFYSRKAGCSMCPCSPGYIIRVKKSYVGKWKALWITHKEVELKAIQRAVKKTEAENYEKFVAGAMGA